MTKITQIIGWEKSIYKVVSLLHYTCYLSIVTEKLKLYIVNPRAGIMKCSTSVFA